MYLSKLKPPFRPPRFDLPWYDDSLNEDLLYEDLLLRLLPADFEFPREPNRKGSLREDGFLAVSLDVDDPEADFDFFSF